MTDTIPNVPRELLEELRDAASESMNATTRQHQIDHFAGLIAKADALLSAPSPANHVEDVRAMVAAPSPAGVDWLEVALSSEQILEVFERNGFRIELGASFSARGQIAQLLNAVGEIERLSDARAIIDGLRGENERIRLNIAEYNEAISCYQSERDQQAQRIGELEGLLLRVQVSLSLDDTEWGYSGAEKYKLLADIRAALSAGKEGE